METTADNPYIAQAADDIRLTMETWPGEWDSTNLPVAIAKYLHEAGLLCTDDYPLKVVKMVPVDCMEDGWDG